MNWFMSTLLKVLSNWIGYITSNEIWRWLWTVLVYLKLLLRNLFEQNNSVELQAEYPMVGSWGNAWKCVGLGRLNIVYSGCLWYDPCRNFGFLYRSFSWPLCVKMVVHWADIMRLKFRLWTNRNTSTEQVSSWISCSINILRTDSDVIMYMRMIFISQIDFEEMVGRKVVYLKRRIKWMNEWIRR
jgi:hypothetical protein